MPSETCNIANPVCLEFCPFAQSLQADIVELQSDLTVIEANAQAASDLAITAMGISAESAVETVENLKPILSGFALVFGEQAIEEITEEIISAPAREILGLATEKINDLAQRAINLKANSCLDKVAKGEITSAEALELIDADEQKYESILRAEEVAELEREAEIAEKIASILTKLAKIGITNIYDEDGNFSVDVVVAQMIAKTDADRKAATVLKEEWSVQLAQAKDCPGLQDIRRPGKIRKVTTCPTFSK